MSEICLQPICHNGLPSYSQTTSRLENLHDRFLANQGLTKKTSGEVGSDNVCLAGAHQRSKAAVLRRHQLYKLCCTQDIIFGLFYFGHFSYINGLIRPKLNDIDTQSPLEKHLASLRCNLFYKLHLRPCSIFKPPLALFSSTEGRSGSLSRPDQ